MPILTRVGGSWVEPADTEDLKVKVGGVWTNVYEGFVRVNGVWRRFHNGTGIVNYTIPMGGIVPFYSADTTAPSGWSFLNATATNKQLRGWDGTLASIGVTGGNSVPVPFSTGTDGSHIGSSTFQALSSGVISSSVAQNSNDTAGAHSHTATPTGGVWHTLIMVQLIKADSTQSMVPAKAVLFGESHPILTAWNVQDHLVMDHSNLPGQLHAGTTTSPFTTNTAGDHKHGSGKAYAYAGYNGDRIVSAGAHSHSGNLTGMSPNAQRKYVRAFTDLVNDFPCCAGHIIGWESTTPPTGWALCDGTNGTIDLRNYYVCADDTQTYGSIAGDNIFTGSFSVTGGSHNHRSSDYPNYITANRYHNDNVSHTHAGSFADWQESPYIRLAFIQRLAT